MIDEMISTVLQVVVFTLIPFLFYLISRKRVKGFWKYIGLKKSNKEANLMAFETSVILFLPPLLLVLTNDAFEAILHNPESMTGKFKEMGFGVKSIFLILIAAVFKTALAEEILFRGFITKRLIALTNYQTGNILQAIIFGFLHTLLFMIITKNLFFLSFIFLFPALGAYVMVYINEKKADGSIIPSWISHTTANILSYSIIGFLI